MAHNGVLIHTCFFAGSPITLGAGTRTSQRIFHATPNASCSCRSKISFRDRDAKIGRGEAYVIVRQNAVGGQVPEWKEIVAAYKRPTVPRAVSIDKKHIERAYIGSESHPYGSGYDRDRIEYYGQLNQEVLAGIGAGAREDARERPATIRMRLPISPAAEFALTQMAPGECVIPNFDDLRTGDAVVTGNPELQIPPHADCRFCGFRILNPAEWPTVRSAVERDPPPTHVSFGCPNCSERRGFRIKIKLVKRKRERRYVEPHGEDCECWECGRDE